MTDPPENADDMELDRLTLLPKDNRDGDMELEMLMLDGYQYFIMS